MPEPVTTYATDCAYMRMALAEAAEAARHGEVPVGAVVVCNGRVIARTRNMTEALRDVTAHAEMLAVTAAADYLGGKYLTDCTLYVTVEPCAMCAGALAWSQVSRVVFGASDPRRGYTVMYSAERPALHPRTRVTSGILAEECAALMKEFFQRRR